MAVNDTGSEGAAASTASALDVSADLVRDVEIHVFEVSRSLKTIQHHVDYLRQYDTDQQTIDKIDGYLAVIRNEFEVLLNQAKQSVEDQDEIKRAADSLGDADDHKRYQHGMKLYEQGKYRVARAVFAALSKTTTDQEIRRCSVESTSIIDQAMADQ